MIFLLVLESPDRFFLPSASLWTGKDQMGISLFAIALIIVQCHGERDNRNVINPFFVAF